MRYFVKGSASSLKGEKYTFNVYYSGSLEAILHILTFLTSITICLSLYVYHRLKNDIIFQKEIDFLCSLARFKLSVNSMIETLIFDRYNPLILHVLADRY